MAGMTIFGGTIVGNKIFYENNSFMNTFYAERNSGDATLTRIYYPSLNWSSGSEVYKIGSCNIYSKLNGAWVLVKNISFATSTAYVSYPNVEVSTIFTTPINANELLSASMMIEAFAPGGANYIFDTAGTSRMLATINYIIPTVSNIKLNTRYSDIVSTLTFDVDYFESAVVTIKQGTAVLSTQTITAKGLTIPDNTFLPGVNTVEITAKNNDVYSTLTSVNFTMENTVPSISVLDPNSVQVNRANAIAVSFAFLNITSWVYECIQGGITKFTSNGTTGTTATVPSSVLSNGEAKNKLTAAYIPAWATSPADYRTAVKETTFTVYGAPSNPTLIVDGAYSTPYPLFKWSNATEQVSYILKIKDGVTVVLDSSEVYGSTIREHLFGVPLENHKTYTAELQIKNQYYLWSTAVTSTFLVEFAELAQPTFNIYADNISACIVVNVESVPDVSFHYHEIYRREINGQWIKIAQDLELIDEYKDFACASDVDYEYKVRAVDGNTAYTDSVVKLCKVKFNKTILSIPFTETAYQVRYNIKKSRDNVEDKTFVVYSGLSQPKMIRGTAKYQTLSISTTFITKAAYDEFRAICDNRVLLLRDGKGLKIYGNVHGIKDDFEYVIYSNVSFSFTEVYYKEGDYIESEQRPLSFADSEW